MTQPVLRLRAAAFVAAMALLLFSGAASADPPARVGRLGHVSGAVSFSPAGDTDWHPAQLNRPLGAGDRLWTDQGARAEIQVGAAFIRLSAATSLVVRQLDDQRVQLQLTQGTLSVSVRRLGPRQVVEVDTPQLALTLHQPGALRIALEPDRSATEVLVRQGPVQASGEGLMYGLDARQGYRFGANGLRGYEALALPAFDEFDHWAASRDSAYDHALSARYVSPDVLGYQELDANGSWQLDPAYGPVWIPYRAAAGWVPYRDGHWVWVAPWGWTWVDDAPWGFAVSHYGRWAYLQGRWGWVPGPVSVPAYYAPALVVFVGGNAGAVGWFPLAPREVYRPPYPVSGAYFGHLNRGHTEIDSTVNQRRYRPLNGNTETPPDYVNRGVPGAVVAVPRHLFEPSQPVPGAMRVQPREQPARAADLPAGPGIPAAPSMPGADDRERRPPGRVFERALIPRPEPAAPLTAPKPAPPVQTVAPPAAAVAPPAMPPAAVPPPEQRFRPEPRYRSEPHVRAEPRGPGWVPPAATPGTPAQRAAEPRPVPPVQPESAPAARPAESRPPLVVPKPLSPPQAQPVSPQAAPPAAAVAPPMAAQPPAPHFRPELRGPASVPPVVTPVMPPQRSAEPRPVPLVQPEVAPAARPVESRPPLAAPRLAPPPPSAQAEPKAEPSHPRRKPEAGAPDDPERERQRAEERRHPSR